MPDRAIADVVIQGGGLVGLATATGLARRGLSVTVLDRKPGPHWQAGAYRPQVTSLNRASEEWLDELGAWEKLRDWRATPVQRIEAVDRHGGPRVAFDAADIGASHLSHIVESELLVAGAAAAAERCGVRRWHPASVTDWHGHADRLDLVLDDGAQLPARLLVAADGGDSPLRGLAGMPVSIGDYDQAAVVGVVKGRRGHDGVARQRFMLGGPLAYLPLGERHAAVVWSRPQPEADRLLALPDDVFRAELEAAAGGWLGGIESLGERGCFPLRWLRAARYSAARVALVGDAAHVIHPLAGQGANLGIADARALTEIVGDAADRGRDPADRLALRRYERVRREANDRVQRAMDAFHWGFATDDAVLRALRRGAFTLTQQSDWLRRWFMDQAMNGP